VIGKGLDAAVTFTVAEGSDENMILRRYEDALPEFFNVSQASVRSIAAAKDSAPLVIEAGVASGSKCERCWRVVSDVGSDARWPSVCSRCAEALNAINFPPTQEAV
jgi:isoleucyl-tRNA synthetase